MIDIFTDSKFCHLYDAVPRPQPSDYATEYFQGKQNGTFVDVGAADGITWSNSLTFELNYNWKGLCIEPHPEFFKKLQQARQATCLQEAVSDTEETVNFVIVNGYAEMLSGLEKHYDTRHKERITREVNEHQDNAYKIQLQTKKLQHILDQHNIDYIDYLSVDTEGAEMAILKGIDWNKTYIDLISLEVNYELEPVNDFMSNLGYKFLRKVCCDAFYSKVS